MNAPASSAPPSGAQEQSETHTADDPMFHINQQFHVLLVEDDALTLKYVEQLLKKCNYQVTTASNGREAIEVLEGKNGQTHVDIILTDILMPEVSGMDLINEVVRGEKWNNVPVIVMSSQESQESVLQAFQAGASDYLIKPVRRNELTNLWQHVWKANRLRSNMSHAESHGAGPSTQSTAHKNNSGASTNNNETSALVSTAQPANPGSNQSSQGTGNDLCENTGTSKKSTDDPPFAVHLDIKDLHATQCNKEAAPSRTPSVACLEVDGPTTTTQPDSRNSSQTALNNHNNHNQTPSPEHSLRCSTPPLFKQSPSDSMQPPSKPLAEKSSISNVSNISNGTSATLPPGLQELAALGLKRQQEREKSAISDAAESLMTLRHSENSSAFTQFTIFLPKAARCDPASSSQQVESSLASAATSVSAPPSMAEQTMQETMPSTSTAMPAHGAFPFPPPPFMFPGALPPPILQFIENLQKEMQKTPQVQPPKDQSAGKAEAPMSWMDHRKAAVAKYLEKKKHRNFDKKVRYESRKRLAEQRPRVRGQFVRQEQLAAQGEDGNGDAKRMKLEDDHDHVDSE